ncbi:MAG: MobF family relaxase [Solirubrobacteraceae bacterium]
MVTPQADPPAVCEGRCASLRVTFGLALSVGKIALGQHRYYEEQVAQGRDDYYSGRGEAPGEWIGRGARALGLEGRVSGEQFNALVAGMDPRDPEVRLRSSDCDPRIAALDLTLSAPKSVSVLAALAPERVTAAIIAAHGEAVEAALAYLEDSAVQVRRGHGGERVEVGEGLIAVAYRHRMSRALDPQLHTHVVAANLTRGPDGRFTALHGTPLYRSAKTAGYLYRAHLRLRVSEQLGLVWGPVRNGAAELAAIPGGVLRGFSRRRLEMERAALAGGIGLGSKAAGQAAALATRERKQYGIDTHTWLEEVRARAGELGLGRAELQAIADEARERLRLGVQIAGVDERVLGERLAGPSGLTERANTFDERAVVQEFAAAAGQGASAIEVRQQAARFGERPDVLRTASGQLTTTDLVACEERLIRSAVGRASEGTAVVDGLKVDRVIAAAARPLTTEQAMVVRSVAGGGRGVDVVEALAGTGKTYTAAVIREVYDAAGYEVIGVAPTGRAARELGDQAGIPARTLDRLLIDLDELGDELPSLCVVVFDEAGMAPTRTTARLLEAAERAGAKVVAIGDPGQLASVQAGGWLRAVGERIGALRLTEVMRQRDPGERRALAALHERLPGPYLEWATREGRIGFHEDGTAARGQAIDEWAGAVAEVGLDQAVVIARDNDTRARLNHAARELRREQGELGEECPYGPVAVAVGDRVICRRNDRLVDVDNGTRGTVPHVDDDQIVIATDSHLVRELPAGYVAEHVEHAYALTGYGMQGATVERAFVVASPRDLTAGWSYTALSRARDATRLLIHDDAPDLDREDIAPSETRETQQRDDLLDRVQARMTVRDDEDLAIEQLAPAAGHADDARITESRGRTPIQERGATRAEPPVRDTDPERLASLRAWLDQLRAQRAALPLAELRRLDEIDGQLARAAGVQAGCAEALAGLPEPRRRFGRTSDPHIVDRVRLTSALNAWEQPIGRLTTERRKLARKLGDPEQIRSELDGLDRAITPLGEKHRALSKALAEREGPGKVKGRRQRRRERDQGIEIDIGGM